MSRRSTLLLLMSCITLGYATTALSASPNERARLATYDTATGESYFALSLTPQLDLPPAPSAEIVILFDTSASQTGLYREDAMSALRSMLTSLDSQDRVQLLAVDLNAIPLSEGFVAPASAEMQDALRKLAVRTPLGSTDMLEVLSRAAESFTADKHISRAVVYIGDGVSRANLLQRDEFAGLVSRLTGQQAAVSSLAIGPQQDVRFLAAIANQTGGRVFVDGENVSPLQSGLALAKAAHATVLWPVKADLPASLGESYPQRIPPFRTDRDSILVGLLADREPSEIRIEFAARGRNVVQSWQVTSEPSSPQFGFLPQLVATARTDDGLSLPTVGSDGLQEAARVINAEAERLVELGGHALSTGDLAGAENAAAAAAARDPGNPQAVALSGAVERVRGQDAGDLRLVQADAGDVIEELRSFEGGQGDFLDDVETEARVQAEIIQAEVEAGLAEARRKMSADPQTAKQDLKILLESVTRAPGIDPGVRSQLRDRIQTAIRRAGQIEIEVENRRAHAEENKAAAIEAQRLVEKTNRERLRIKQLLDRFNSLLEEQKYDVAEAQVAMQIRETAPDAPIGYSAMWNARNLKNVNEMVRFRDLRHRNFVDTLYHAERSAIPFSAEPPLVYPSAEFWEQITSSRKRYSSVDLAGEPGSAEERIATALEGEVDFQYFEQPLQDVLDDIQAQHSIPIVIDSVALEEYGIGTDTAVNINLSGVTLKSALRLMLNDLDLTYVIQNEVMQITTPEEAEAKLITKVYPVGDLVIPIISGGGGAGGGGLGGGGGGGGLGGGGGGLGGGGGGGGGGLGGGGGAFAVEEDELRLGSKKKVPAPAKAVNQPQARRAVNSRPTRIRLRQSARESLHDAWNQHFAAHANDSAADRVDHQRQVRETVRQLQAEAQRALAKGNAAQANARFTEITELINAALRHRQPQPWMYEALALTLLVRGEPVSEVERALMSAVDFSGNVEEVLNVATYMTKLGLDARALKLYQEVAQAHPYRPDPYINGLEAARRLGNEPGIRWALVGILSQAWPNEHREIAENARRQAQSLLQKMQDEKREREVTEFVAQATEATIRDCIVKVTWTGDADIDMMVEEPSATVCSLRNPRTTSGGVMLGDAFARADQQTTDGYSEIYICPKGFKGQYRLFLKRIWGEVTAGKVTVEIITNYGTEHQTYGKQQIPLAEKDAIVNFELPRGRRTEPLEAEKVATLERARLDMGRAILAQQFGGLADRTASRDFALALRRGLRSGIDPRLLGRRGGVGFMPVLTLLPEGNQMNAMAVISADRRYVRFTLLGGFPISSGVTNVDTFSFAGGGGAGGGGGGLGGGGGGGGGGGFL